MDSGWVAAVATILSTIVIALTAIAAFRQLTHGRNANDIVVYLRLTDHLDSAEMREARAAVRVLGARVRDDAEYRARLADPYDDVDDFRAVGALLRFLEHISVLVTKGGVAENIILAEYADTFVDIWDNLREAIVLRRKVLGPETGRAFEHLAMRAKRYIDSGEMAREYDALERDTRPLPMR